MESTIWISIFYFGDFVNDDQGKWTWKRSGSDEMVEGVPISSDTLYHELYCEVLNLCKVDSSFHEIEMRFLLPGNGQFTVLIKITSNKQVQWLLSLNQKDHCPICVTLVSKCPVEHPEVEEDNDSFHEVEDDEVYCEIQNEGDNLHCEMQTDDEKGVDRTESIEWDELEIAQDNNVDIIAANDNDVVVSTEGFEKLQNNREENRFTNEHLIASTLTSQVIPKDADLEDCQIFNTKKDLMMEVHMLAMKYNFEFRVKKSNKEVYTIVCIDKNCKWRLRATKFKHCDYFQVRKYAREHTCSVSIRRNDHRQAKSWVIGRHIMPKFQNPNTLYRSTDIINDMRREFGVDMSYQRARKSRECALEVLRGSFEDSYAKLGLYSHNLAITNPGTALSLDIDGENRFKYFFMALGPCIRRFHSSMWKVVVVDGTFLTGKYKGTLIVATCQDANIQIYPLAWGIVDSENDASWTWFFTKLKGVTGDTEDLVVISDRHQSIINGVLAVYQNAHHGHCIYHIKGHFRTITRKSEIFLLFKKAAEANTLEEFGNCMSEIKRIDIKAWKYLEKARFHTWARSYFQGNRYNIMTSNNAESLNSVFKKDRQNPILALIESIRKRLQKWFYERRANAQSCTSTLTPIIEEKLRKNVDKAKKFVAEPIDQFTYDVRNDSLVFVVKLDEKTCTCRRFQLEHLSCEHAVVAAKKSGFSIYLFCSLYYTIEYWKVAYSDTICPVPNEVDWEIPENFGFFNVLPPLVRRRGGRPKTTRIPSIGEFPKRHKCSRCAATGHNRLSCTSHIL